MNAATGPDERRGTARRHPEWTGDGRPTRPGNPGRVTRLPAFVGKA